MHPEWLRYYVTLARVGNFHHAAEQPHITPQALSKAIAAGRLAIVSSAPCTFHDSRYVIWRQGVQPSPAARALLKAVQAPQP